MPKIKYSTDGELYSDGFLSDYYAMIRYPMYYGVPGVLIEHCFMSNEKDRNQFLSNDFSINAMAEADAKAIIDNKELFRIDKNKNSIGLTIKELEIGTTASNQQYIWGEVHINNWINGMIKQPGQLPKIRLVSTDGAKSYDMWVANREGNLYYFDSLIEPLDRSYEYYIEVESQEKNIIPVYNTGNIEISNKTLGKIGNDTIKVKNNKIVYETPPYVGNVEATIRDLSIKQLDNDKIEIEANIKITETINGNKEIPDKTPKVRLENENNKTKGTFSVNKISEDNYKCVLNSNNLEIGEKYVIKVESGNSSNLSTEKVKIANYNKNEVLLKAQRTEITINNNQIVKSLAQYNGKIETELLQFKMSKNAEGKTFIYGDLLINEVIDGVSLKPDVVPNIKIKSVDGTTKELECWAINTTKNEYHFDCYIEGIDIDKEYIIEVELINNYNVSENKTCNILGDKTQKLGNYAKKIVWIEDGKMKFKPDTYKGDLGNEIISIYLNKNSQGKYFISGNAYITEWIDGTKWSIPEEIPNISIKTTEGEQVYNCWVSNIGENKYYFDSYIEGIDISKQYVIEIELANKANISENKKGNAYFSKDIDLGNYKQKEMRVQKSIISFVGNEYKADLGHQLLWLELHQNAQGKSYINGNIYITEWINGIKWSVPNGIPSIVIKTTEGTKVYEAWVNNIGGNKYYFDCYIEGIDKNKQYEIEINLTNKNNTSTNKNAKINFGNKQQLGQYREFKVELENTFIRFMDETIRIKEVQKETVETLEENGQITETEETEANKKEQGVKIEKIE